GCVKHHEDEGPPAARERAPMAFFFLADTHFGPRTILRYCNRPFLSAAERALLAAGEDFEASPESVRRMDDALLDNINAAVGPDDTLWHLGDFSFGGYEHARACRERIRCHNVLLVWGNHDHEEVRGLFSACYDQTRIRVGGQRLFLNHYPMLSWQGSGKGTWMLHGHVHGTLRRDPLVRPWYDTKPILDVGVDGPDGAGSAPPFRPLSLAELHEALDARTPPNVQPDAGH